MRYGYFDEANKEYVIDRPDTPAPWANYLGSPEYGAIISQADTALQNQVQTEEFFVISSTALTSRADTFICVTMTAKITGRPHGSQLEKI